MNSKIIIDVEKIMFGGKHSIIQTPLHIETVLVNYKIQNLEIKIETQEILTLKIKWEDLNLKPFSHNIYQENEMTSMISEDNAKIKVESSENMYKLIENVIDTFLLSNMYTCGNIYKEIIEDKKNELRTYHFL